MPPRLDDDKRSLQLLLAVQRQDTLKLGMHGILGRGQNPQINNSRPAALNEYKGAKVTIASHEDPSVLMGDVKQLRVFSLRQTKLSDWNHVMSQAAQETNGDGIDIVVG